MGHLRTHHRALCLLFCAVLTSVVTAHEPIPYPAPASGAHHSHAGSYYHYHVPVGGSHAPPPSAMQHAQGHYMSSWDHNTLLWLIPLALLLLAPLVFLPLLLKALLIPAGLLLLGLLPLLLMGGMMMMMMMMPMMGGGMMMMRNPAGTAVTTARTVVSDLIKDGLLQSTYSAIANDCGDDVKCKLQGAWKAVQAFRDKYQQQLNKQQKNKDSTETPGGAGVATSTDPSPAKVDLNLKAGKKQRNKKKTQQSGSADSVYTLDIPS